MVNGIRTGNPCGFNKECSSKFHAGSQVRQETPEEGWRTYLPKCCGNNEDEDNSLKTLNDKNHQASSQKFKQLFQSVTVICQWQSEKNQNDTWLEYIDWNFMDEREGEELKMCCPKE